MHSIKARITRLCESLSLTLLLNGIMYTKLSMVECHSIDTLDQHSNDTWLIPWLHRHSINTWCWSSQVIFADIPLSVKQYIHAWIGWHSTNYTVLANCQSSADWDIDWVSAKYRLRCPWSAEWWCQSTPKLWMFSAHSIQKRYVIPHKVHLPVGVKFSASSFRFLLLSPLSRERQMTIW